MKIEIDDHRKLFAVKDEFNTAFPNFKIEFFDRPSKSDGTPSGKIMKHVSSTLGQCRLAHNKGTISINVGMTVGELEQNFRNVYEVSVQIFQKQGNNWLEAESNVSLN